MAGKCTFALFFGNRGFFPASLQAVARKEMRQTLKRLGHPVLMLEESATRHGAVETPAEGRVYAEFLRRNHGKYQGVILCLPNFGDETGAVAALQDAGVPILVQRTPTSWTGWRRSFAATRSAASSRSWTSSASTG